MVRKASTSPWDYVKVVIYPDKMVLGESENGQYAELDDNTSATSTEDTWYDVHVICDGSDVEVWRGPAGGSTMEKVLETDSCNVTTSARVAMVGGTDSSFSFDNVRIANGSLSTTTTYAYNNANELTSMSRNSVTTSFTYDEWGRMISKYTTNDSADYEYRYGDKLYSVTSTFPDEGTVTYDYGGDGKRRERTVSGGSYTWYNWDAGWSNGRSNIINEENSGGTLTNTYVHAGGRILADVAGSNPSSGTYQYYVHDNLGSTRGLWAQDKSSLGVREYVPYGGDYSRLGESVDFRWTGRLWDSPALLYYGSQYDPRTARYLTRPYRRNGNNPVSNGEEPCPPVPVPQPPPSDPTLPTPEPPAPPPEQPGGEGDGWVIDWLKDVGLLIVELLGKPILPAVNQAVKAYSNINKGVKAGEPHFWKRRNGIEEALEGCI